MPTFDQSRFIGRAVDSLLANGYRDWELLILDDGSPDDTGPVVRAFLTDERIHYCRWSENVGLGAAMNRGLAKARGDLIAYLPSDDVYYADHLELLTDVLESNPDAVLAYSGVRHHYNRTATGQIDGYPLQLVQALHRRTGRAWLERAQLVTDDLDKMFWLGLRQDGVFVGTGRVSCEWVDHPAQRHKVIQEPEGGINPYRRRYRVAHPLRFHSSLGNPIDEVEHYRSFRERPATPPGADGLKILLVGELAYNAERVLALEERGHQLFGLWMPTPYWYNTIGPLPFGHVQDVPLEDWRSCVQRLKPDLIYALLNWQTVPFAHHVLRGSPDIPFVWHFKEGPFICLEKGTWSELIDLYVESDGQIYCSPEMRDWFHTVAPELAGNRPSMILDGDLPKRDWFTTERSPRLSASDGEIHTFVPGRPIGLHPETVAELAHYGIHLHFYGDFTHGQWRQWITRTRRLAPGHLHLHAHVGPEAWVREFSQYDAGWLHAFTSENGGELRRANWDDLNYPARVATLAAAGVPMLQRDNRDAIVAVQALTSRLGTGVYYSNAEDLAQQLRSCEHIEKVRLATWERRQELTFDFHAGRLVEFFRQVISSRVSGHRAVDEPIYRRRNDV